VPSKAAAYVSELWIVMGQSLAKLVYNSNTCWVHVGYVICGTLWY